MAQPRHSYPNCCDARSERGRVSHTGRYPPPLGNGVTMSTLEDVNELLRLNLWGEVDWRTYVCEGKEEDTLVTPKNTFARWIRCFFRDYPKRKLDGDSSGNKPKYFTGPGIDFTLAAFLVLWLSWYVVDTGWHEWTSFQACSVVSSCIASIPNVFAEFLEGSFERDLSEEYILNDLEELEVEPNTAVESSVVGELWAFPGDLPTFDDITLMWIAEVYNPQSTGIGYDQGATNPPRVVTEEICSHFLIRNQRTDETGQPQPSWGGSLGSSITSMVKLLV
ncbi:hypothetical protein Acr_09g0003230 [Actinidia rufa]|uniref:Uncharacterized protein n=1 Tax=Actinidia rufa TaxID=165716 RepID=A0A7J0F7I1_9ERIC|nr:hypothetical protein Acr_09g0003230 [Actinidia rufa]